MDIDKKLFKNSGPAKDSIPLGVTASCMSPSGALFVGGGDGGIRLMKIPPQASKQKAAKKIFQTAIQKVEGAITSLICESEVEDTVSLLVGTKECSIHRVTCCLRDMK